MVTLGVHLDGTLLAPRGALPGAVSTLMAQTLDGACPLLVAVTPRVALSAPAD